MKRLTVKEFSMGRYLIYSAIFVLLGLLVGGGSAFARPFANVDGTHLEAVVEFFFVMPILCLTSMLLFLRTPYKQAAPALAGQLTLLWLANMAGRFIASLFQEPLLDEFYALLFVFWFGAAVLTALLLGGIRKVWPLRYPSSNCQQCGYSLKGIGVSGSCPECGAPFTVESLGISESELSA